MLIKMLQNTLAPYIWRYSQKTIKLAMFGETLLSPPSVNRYLRNYNSKNENK